MTTLQPPDPAGWATTGIDLETRRVRVLWGLAALGRTAEQRQFLTHYQAFMEIDEALADGYVQAASAKATERAYDSDFADFSAWCKPLGLAPLPAKPSTVAAYLASLADLGLKASTIRRRKAAIAHTHSWSGYEPPTSTDFIYSGVPKAGAPDFMSTLLVNPP